MELSVRISDEIAISIGLGFSLDVGVKTSVRPVLPGLAPSVHRENNRDSISWAIAIVPGENSSLESESHEKAPESVSLSGWESFLDVESTLERRSCVEDSCRARVNGISEAISLAKVEGVTS